MSWFGDIFSGGQSTSEAEANVERLQKLASERLEQRQEDGTISPEQLSLYQAELERGGQLESVDKAAAAGLIEGAGEGLQNVLQAPGQVVGFTLGNLFKGFPWWIWPLLLIVAFFYLGGEVPLRRYIKKL